jgi:hypothetical protein
MRNKVAKYNRKKSRQAGTEFLCLLLGSMTFKERVLFAFTGRYYKVLQRVYKKMRVKS